MSLKINDYVECIKNKENHTKKKTRKRRGEQEREKKRQTERYLTCGEGGSGKPQRGMSKEVRKKS